ncbi:MAG: gluconokinase, GntK/IdnK-type [Hyphomonadaceae bacterium]|nr:gluconokinase, GntK/IdnK-type [Hyphomonadaceae bacterium]
MAEKVVVVMGVSGSGKSSVGSALALALGADFIDADDHHSAANRQKQAAGTPLTNEDRKGWIASIAADLNARAGTCTLACSALNETVRGWLAAQISAPLTYVLLEGEKALIAERMKARAGHFMPASLLDSQFAALDPPAQAIRVDIARPVEVLVADILASLDAG